MPSQTVIFTDLDGTLLNHETYCYAEAKPSLQQLKEHNIPLVFNSSKTCAEITQLREELGIAHPFIVENGGAVCIPADYFAGFPNQQITPSTPLNIEYFGQDYQAICHLLDDLRQQHGWVFRGFHDLSANQLSDITNLSVQTAEQAKQRLCSEPLQWQDTDSALVALQQSLEKQGLRLLKGGRFYHVMGQFDKAAAITWLVEKYQQLGLTVKTIGLGDGENDRRMLETVDHAVVMLGKQGEHLQLQRTDNVIYSQQPAPLGWHLSLQTLLFS